MKRLHKKTNPQTEGLFKIGLNLYLVFKIMFRGKSKCISRRWVFHQEIIDVTNISRVSNAVKSIKAYFLAFLLPPNVGIYSSHPWIAETCSGECGDAILHWAPNSTPSGFSLRKKPYISTCTSLLHSILIKTWLSRVVALKKTQY